MSNEGLEIAKKRYQTGRNAFECGKYREAAEELEKAAALLAGNTRFGGEVQIWLATAYEASNRNEEAIALCEKLKRHPHGEINQQARRLQYIWQAPKLKRPQEWMTEIPDFSDLDRNDGSVRISAKKPKSQLSDPLDIGELEDLSQIDTRDNSFLVLSLVAIAFTVLYLLWSSGIMGKG